MKLKKGYSSHGIWSTFGEIKKIELERGNKFTDGKYPVDTPCIWVTPTKRLALRYAVSSNEWDRITDINEPLTSEEKEILKQEVETIHLQPTDRIVWEDGDEGFLVCRKI